MSSVVETFMAKASVDKKGWTSGMADMQKSSTKFKRVASLSFKSAMSGASKMGSALKSAAKVGAAGIAAFTAAAGTVAAMVKKTADAGDAISKASERTGLAADFISKIKYAADLSGSSVEEFENAIRKMQKTAGDATRGSKTAAEAFSRLGISVTDSSGRMKDTQRLFMEAASALSKVKNSTQKATYAQDIFGRSGTRLLPMLSQGTKGLTGMMSEAEKLGYVWSNKTAKSAADLNDSISRVWTVAGGMVERFSVELFPAIQQITDGMVGWYAANRELINGKIVEWAGTLKAGINAAWQQVKSWSEDGTFLLWWERAKLAALGLKVALAGVQSSLDYVLYGVYKAMAAKNDLQYLYEGNTKKGYEAARRAMEYDQLANQYKDQGSSRSVAAAQEYKAQAQRVADVGGDQVGRVLGELLRDAIGLENQPGSQRGPRQVSREPSQVGGTVINVNVANNGLQRIENKEADMIAEAVRKRMVRGKVKSLAGVK